MDSVRRKMRSSASSFYRSNKGSNSVLRSDDVESYDDYIREQDTITERDRYRTYKRNEEHPPDYDWYGLEKPRLTADIVYKLNINRREKINDPDHVTQDGCYFQDKPFNVSISPSELELDKKDLSSPKDTRIGPVLEVVQQAYDSRYSCRTKPHSLQLNELRISKISESHIVVHSNPLLEALRSIVKYYPEYPEEKLQSAVTVREPYALFVHHWKEIEDFLAANSKQLGKNTSQQVADMRVLYNFLAPKLKPDMSRIDFSLKNTTPKIEFGKIWYLFRPGQDVYVQSSDDVHACVVTNVYNNFEFSARNREWRLDMWSLNTDGRRIAREERTAIISLFSGHREVKSLPVCPVSIWDAFDNGKRRASMMKRSELYMQALRSGSLHATYAGMDHVDQRQYYGKVVLDCVQGWSAAGLAAPPPIGSVADSHNTYVAYDYIYVKKEDLSVEMAQSRESNIPVASRRSRLEDDDNADPNRSDSMIAVKGGWTGRDMVERGKLPGEVDALAKARYGTTEITDHQLLLLYPQAPAFALSTKRWMVVSLDRITPVESSSESINNLVLVDDDALQTIRALSVRQNSKQSSWSADFIEGKGSGQIILLHGPPGVGKTFTVESIAAWLQRPLLALTVADIGTVETQIEQELMRWFDLAEAWNAVLLVDEADIFLEQRKTRDLARNGLVSAFLRRMEYFKGLLFLTTNRVGQIDDAFMSRVHVAIGYEKLTVKARQEIWKGFFNKVSSERAGKLVIGPSAKKFVLEDPFFSKIKLNGRDIRNALQTAITLAEFETLESRSAGETEIVIVEEGHFRRVLQMGENFRNYITSIRKEDADKRANQRGDRNDYGDLIST